MRIGSEMPLTRENIVSEAENEDNPLHEFFDWDDSIAGHKWRLEQATLLVNAIIEQPVGNDEPTTHSFEIIKTNDHREYKYVYDIFDNKDWRNQVIQQALKMLQSWRKKYDIYTEFHEVTKAIHKVEVKFKDDAKTRNKARKRKYSTASVSA